MYRFIPALCLLFLLAACGGSDELYDFDGDGALDAEDCAPEDPAYRSDKRDYVNSPDLGESPWGRDWAEIGGWPSVGRSIHSMPSSVQWKMSLDPFGGCSGFPRPLRGSLAYPSPSHRATSTAW